MKFRLGLMIGFCAGYYLGTAAGKERHEQINRMIRKVRRSEAFDMATSKARAVVDLTVERAKDVVDHRTDGKSEGPSGPVSVTGTTPVSRD